MGRRHAAALAGASNLSCARMFWFADDRLVLTAATRLGDGLARGMAGRPARPHHEDPKFAVS
jgi:hypothetical protein